MLNRKNISLVVWTTVVLLIISGCSGLAPQATPTAEPEPVDSFVPVASATGVVVPAQSASLSLTAGGVVAEVLVREDESVDQNQVLVRLEGTENLKAAISAAKFELFSARQAYDQLYRNPELREAEAYQAVVAAKQALKDAQGHLDNMNEAAPKLDVEQAWANMILAKDKRDKAEDDYDQWRHKREDNPIRAAFLSKLAQAQKDYEGAVRLYNNLTGTSSELDFQEAESDLALAQAQLVVAEREYETLKAGPDPDDVSAAKERIANSEAQLAAAEAALNDLELAAPFPGIVSELYLDPSEYISPGQPVLLLADTGHLRVETTDLNEIDVARIEAGDTVSVTFDALPEVTVTGKVVRIASKASEGSGVNYKVVVELDEIPTSLRWGMTAFVDIRIEP